MAGTPIRILLVEDSTAEARLAREDLNEADPAGFELTHAVRLDEALGLLDVASFDLLLLDLGLPDSQGLDTFLRANAREARLPIVITTGLDDESLAAEAVRRGAQDYLVKGKAGPGVLARAVRYAVERKRAQEEIEGLARFPDENPSPVLRVSSEGTLLYANPASLPLLSHWGTVVGRPVPPAMGELVSAVHTSGEFWITTVEFDDRLLSLLITPVSAADYVNIYGRDIGERRRLEQHLRQMQKMEAIGTLAGGVAHDFNNLLTGILGYANELKLGSDPGDEVHEAATVIENAATRAAELTRQLLGFARKGKMEEVPVDVHRLIQEVVSMLGHTLLSRNGRRIRISQRLMAQPSYVLGDQTQLQQVLLNLGVNARDAMPEGGELVIETCAAELDEEYCRDHVGASPGRYLMISVTDTGSGIPKEIVDRIFEPYFTTKREGEGTGMGLAMVYGIVKNHGGSVRVYSEAGRGTTFKVYLPVAAAPEPVVREARHETPIRGEGRILVVEDEDVIQAMATRMLESLGYDVVAASDGQEAVEYYEQHGGETDLVIIDMIMPRMNGRDCFRRLREMNPLVRAILSTGYGLDSAVRELLGDGMIGYVQKPYVIGQLSEAVAKALGGTDHKVAEQGCTG
jgi:signal transduction histidine kinase